jgi:hypothetical protein
MEWGSTVEWSILEYHARVEDLTIERPGTLVHPDFDFVCATPDGIGRKDRQVDVERRVIEAKNVGRWMANEWGERKATTRRSTTSRRCIGRWAPRSGSGSRARSQTWSPSSPARRRASTRCPSTASSTG